MIKNKTALFTGSFIFCITYWYVFFCSQRSSGNVPLSQSNESSDFTGFLVYSLKTSDKVVRYGENNQVEFSEHPTVVQRGNERTINLLVSTPDVA